MTKPRFLDAIRDRPIVFDGGMGTQLYERGIYINRSFDDANLTRADLVRQIHQEYVLAGADVITTNTFSANRLKLARHGLEDRLVEINHAAVEIARQVALDRAWVAGSIGPTGRTPTMLTDAEIREIREAFAEQVRVLLEAGVELIVIETFRLLSEVRLAIEAAREAIGDRDVPIVATMAFDVERRTGDGADPERVAMLLADWGADVVGANCMEGPHVIFDVVGGMLGGPAPVIAQPNAGYPRKVDERLVYMATPEYFGVYAKRLFKAGVSGVGGCCGTSPEHVRRIAAAARMMGGGQPIIEAPRVRSVSARASSRDAVPVADRTELATKIDRVWRERLRPEEGREPAPLTRDHFAVSVEVNPPKGLNPMRAIEAARMLQAGGVDVINIADGPRASVRMSNWALAKLVQDRLGMEAILHLCARDRNLLGLQADVLAYNALGLNNLVVITGDPPKVGDYPHATAVFDLDSVGMLRMLSNFNDGVDPAGKDVGQVTRFFCACGAEPAATDYDRELRRLEAKCEAGASLIMTQPVYDGAVLDRFLHDIKGMNVPVMVGLLPLASWRNAEFLHNEVPGMAVPSSIRERMREAGSGEQARAVGVQIAQETLEQVKDRVVGAYIMPPFGRYRAALEILSCVPGYELPEADSEGD